MVAREPGVHAEKAFHGAGGGQKEDTGWLLKLFLKGKSDSPPQQSVSKGHFWFSSVHLSHDC